MNFYLLLDLGVKASNAAGQAGADVVTARARLMSQLSRVLVPVPSFG